MPTKLRIAISGSSGLIGSALVEHFEQAGHDLTLLVRRPPTSKVQHRQVAWQPESGMLESGPLEELDIVINLGGANLAGGRWTDSRKELLRRSRLDGTELLAKTLARLSRPPRVLLSASAIGIYGDRPPNEAVSESTTPGDDFLAELCRNWEAACQPAVEAGIRTVKMRFGVVLAAEGGALAKLLPFFRWGLGGRSGAGHQIMSWVALSEVPVVVDHLIRTDSLSGPVNVVSPQAVSNREFTRELGHQLHRPTLFFQPAWLLKLLFGEMARQTILAGARVVPEKLIASGYEFRYPHLREALAAVAR